MKKTSTAPNYDTSLINEFTKAPRYYQVYSLLRGWIFDGNFAPGSRLPSESELCETFGVSKITIRRAIELLANEELLFRVHGKGTFVTEDLSIAPNIGDMSQLIRKVDRLAKKSKVQNVEISTETASKHVAVDLRIEPGAKVERISYVRSVDGAPAGYRIGYMPADLELNITTDEIKKKPIMTLLEEKGVHISGADQLIGASLADTSMAALLQTSVGVPLVRIRLVVFDDDGEPVETSTSYYLADRYQHHVFLTRSPGKTQTVVGTF